MTGPARDFVGYGRDSPLMTWPRSRLVAVNLVVCYEEGAERSIPDGDDQADGWGEYPVQAPLGERDLGTETHYEYGSRVGIWRIARLLERAGVAATISACAEALARNGEVTAWLRETAARFQDLLGWRPIGWNSRTRPSVHTRDLLIEAGGFL